MTSARIRGWGSYFSKKIDDTFYSLIPSERQDSNQEESEPQEAEPQEADPPYQQELNEIRERREAIRGGHEGIAAYNYRLRQERGRYYYTYLFVCFAIWCFTVFFLAYTSQ